MEEMANSGIVGICCGLGVTAHLRERERLILDAMAVCWQHTEKINVSFWEEQHLNMNDTNCGLFHHFLSLFFSPPPNDTSLKCNV